jgi:pimeloyl-ACP methyl ester carboxylesterase
MNKQASNLKFLRALTITVLGFYGSGLPAAAQVVTPPWSAPASTIVVSEEREFQNGDVHLRGTLYLPGGPKPFPAVIAFHSASSATQDLPLYQHLKDLLPALGYAVFIYDRRGSGKSTGKRAGTDFNTLADDGLAALRMLVADKRINARKIGFWGLSQGGWLSVLAASRSRQVAFAISISAPLTTPDVQMNFAVENILRVKGFSDEDIRAAIRTRTSVDDFMRGRGDRPAVEQMLADAVKRPWFKYSYISPMLDAPAHSQWAKEIALDPITTLERVHCPVLILFGADDPWVPVRTSAELLSKLVNKKANLSYAVIAGANHEMATTVPPEKELDASNATTFAPDSPSYFGILAKWLSQPDQRSTLR